ncbi:DNA repair protein RadC [Candidatus Pacearchaeota archaeon]|nr:DNA repair protein RadC [Candidatus Pacearchaeota archaeon]
MNDPPYICDNSGLYTFTRPLAEKEVIEIACSLLKTKYDQNPILNSPEDVTDYLKLKLSPNDREIFVCIFLDSKNAVISFETLFWGTINSNVVYPREVAKRALSLNATSVIFAHNHPSGNPEPSEQDRLLTDRLKTALSLIDISVLHIVVAGDKSLSFKNQGLI